MFWDNNAKLIINEVDHLNYQSLSISLFCSAVDCRYSALFSNWLKAYQVFSLFCFVFFLHIQLMLKYQIDIWMIEICKLFKGVCVCVCMWCLCNWLNVYMGDYGGWGLTLAHGGCPTVSSQVVLSPGEEGDASATRPQLPH